MVRITTALALALIALLFLAACDTFGLVGSSGAGQLQTAGVVFDATVSDREIRLEVPVTFTNDTRHMAEFTGCKPPEPPLLEKRVRERWVLAYQPFYLGCLSPPFIVEPGGSLEFTHRALVGLPGGNMLPEWGVGEVTGTYRLRWWVRIGGEAHTIYSNRFELREVRE